MLTHIATLPCGCKRYKDFIYSGSEWRQTCHKCHPQQTKITRVH